MLAERVEPAVMTFEVWQVLYACVLHVGGLPNSEVRACRRSTGLLMFCWHVLYACLLW